MAGREGRGLLEKSQKEFAMTEVHSNPNGWFFAKEVDFEPPNMKSLYDLYCEQMNTREEKRKNLERAFSAALDTLMTLERMAHSDGFRLKVITSDMNGAPLPVFEGTKVTFVQSYRVVLEDGEK